MQQIISFLLKNKNFLLYLFLLFLSLLFTVQSHSYHRSKFVNSANFLTGGIYGTISNIQDYFKLKSRNQSLIEENARLREIVQASSDQLAIEDYPATPESAYSFMPAKVIKNSYSKTDNIITIKKGKEDDITPDMGVITSKGIVGIIDNTSSSYSTILSILNSNFQTSAKLRNSNHFGTLKWNGKDPNIVEVSDIQEQAPVSIGDTIETSGRSVIFPQGIVIGTVQNKTLDASNNFYTLTVRLVNDMTDLGHVYIIKNRDIPEIQQLENQATHE